MTLSFYPILHPWFVVLIAIALVALLTHGSLILRRKNVPPRWIGYLGALRILAIVVFVLCLLRPVLSYRAHEEKKPDVLVLLDTSKSMAAPSAGGESRLQKSIGSLRSSGLIESLEASANIRWFAFDRDARPITSNDLNQLSATGDSTQLGDSLATVWQYHQSASDGLSSGQSIPARLIVVSDGNDLSSERSDAIEEARSLGQLIYTLPAPDVVDPARKAGITIAAVQAPLRVLAGSETRFRAIVTRTSNDGATVAAPTTLVVAMSEEGRSIASQEVAFAAGETEKTIAFSHRPTEGGTRHFALSVASPTDIAPSVKPYELTVDVVGRNNQVLVLEDTWRWEFKFLRRVFEDDPNFSFTAFLPRTPGIHMQFAEPDRTARLSSFPQSRAELEFFDLVILGDVKPQRWPQALADAIYQGVAEKGKSLVIIAGPNLVQLAENPQLGALLPVEVSAESAHPIRGPVRVQPTTEGMTSPLFYTPADAKQAVAWGQLPPMDQIYPAVRKKPAATILLEAPEHANTYGSIIVMAEHTVGKGRVLFIATDTLWKWQTLTRPNESGNTPYQIFWRQTLRTLAPERWSGENENLWLQTDRTRYTAGQTVQVTLEIDADRAGATDHPQLSGAVTLPDGRELPLMLTGDAKRPGVFHSDFEAAQPGRYMLSGTLWSDNKQAGNVATRIDVEPATVETSRLSTNHAFLQRLASATGGQVIDTANRATWPTFAASDTVSFEQAKTVDLWSNFNLVLLLLTVLGLDWLLRLLRGFV